MITTTFPHGNADQSSSQSLHSVAEFPVAWFQATPAFLILRPAARFLSDWVHATPAGIALRALFH
ncbi:hypothetical protein J2847_000855 [Azospirillum agricola]|uniref:hypothetical protein n=1 Tax=Azospirillum agricola TaxID=1720247 RepID=UPI001AE94BFF|nr:hypothetical protein [Azospirillum agricola]MBP2227575.1 hypothetical protein [Azospirillum agricola]